jgi:hypothetical protein
MDSCILTKLIGIKRFRPLVTILRLALKAKEGEYDVDLGYGNRTDGQTVDKERERQTV